MSMEIDILHLIDSYGIRGLIFGLIIIVISTIIKSSALSKIFTKLSDRLIDWFLKNKSSNDDLHNVHESDILNHDIFNYIDFWIYSKIPTFKFSTEYRTIIFRRYLVIYLKSYKKGLSEFVNSGDYKKMDQSELWKNFLSMTNKIVWEYERESKEAGIPDVVINKVKIKNNDTIQLTIDLINNVSNSQFYESSDNFLKVYSILNIVLSVLENTISNSESICNSINGQLSGLSTFENGKEIKEP
jgi:hypothetical protein